MAEQFKKLDALAPRCVVDFLNIVYESRWCKSYFLTILKCDIIDNNMADTINGWILGNRLKLIISMLEKIRLTVMQMLYTKRMFTAKWHSNIAPKVMKNLEENKKKSWEWSLWFNSEFRFEIKKKKEMTIILWI